MFTYKGNEYDLITDGISQSCEGLLIDDRLVDGWNINLKDIKLIEPKRFETFNGLKGIVSETGKIIKIG